MAALVSVDEAGEIADDLAVGVVRDFGHFQHTPGQFVAVSLPFLGLAEFFQGHPAAVVGRADAELDGGHRRVLLEAEGTRREGNPRTRGR